MNTQNKLKKNDYRELYRNNICDIPIGFDIHHIDFNRENNGIENLLMLPRDLHNKYHLAVKEVGSIGDLKLNLKILSILDNGHVFNEYVANIIKKYNDIYSECKKYADYKQFLLGKIPNIHKI